MEIRIEILLERVPLRVISEVIVPHLSEVIVAEVYQKESAQEVEKLGRRYTGVGAQNSDLSACAEPTARPGPMRTRARTTFSRSRTRLGR